MSTHLFRWKLLHYGSREHPAVLLAMRFLIDSRVSYSLLRPAQISDAA